MIPSIQKMYCLRLLLLVVFISLSNTVLAQWVKVDTSGIMTSIAATGNTSMQGFLQPALFAQVTTAQPGSM